MSTKIKHKISGNLLKKPPIEDIFTSIGKLKILSLLANCNELNITAISKNTNLNHARVKIQLKELQEISIIQEKRFGRIKIFKINENNHAAVIIKKFFKEWNNE